MTAIVANVVRRGNLLLLHRPANLGTSQMERVCEKNNDFRGEMRQNGELLENTSRAGFQETTTHTQPNRQKKIKGTKVYY